MKHEILISRTFGSSASNGEEANRFRISEIDAYLNLPDCEQVILDFTGIRIANSSFVNALVSVLFEQHGTDALRKLLFKGCLPTIQALVQSAVDLGMIKHAERVS